jgi:ABC-type phosphate transport system substrate-binding protein
MTSVEPFLVSVTLLMRALQLFEPYYQSIGSGGGIKQIKARTVDFGASDMPLPAEELEKEGLIQFPAIMGGVVPVVNLEGIKPGQLKLTGNVVAAIYMGKITKWNASEIAALNPGLKLPTDDITAVHRGPTAPPRHSCGSIICPSPARISRRRSAPAPLSNWL